MAKDRSIFRHWVPAASVVIALECGSAFAFDTDPYTYLQAPDGTTSVQLYGTYRESTNFTYSAASTPYTKAGAAKDSRIDAESTYVHYTGFFEVNGVMVDPHVIVPYATVNHTELSGRNFDGSTGWADPMVAVVIAPIHAPDNSQVLGLGIGTYMPAGQYEPGKLFTLGGNRWQPVVQLAGVQAITPELTLSGSVDVSFYGTNNQAGTGHQIETQQNSYQIQPWLRYRPIPMLAVSFGYSQTYGGKQFLNGVQDGLETAERQIRFDASLALAENLFLGQQIDRDIAVDGGYRESIVLCTRLTVLF